MRRSTLIIVLALLHITAAPAVFGAYCSLRDPVAAIKSLYNTSKQYRSLVAPITEQHRQSVKQRLPFTLHRSEIGKHTLYMVLDGNKPIGFVQARSELADWGLIEIGWAINFDMTINGLFFQRCRSPDCNKALSDKLSTLLSGKSFSEIRQLLNSDGTQMSHGVASIFKDNENLALLTIR
ncbi:MAG: hypothetical protein KZQ87_13395, partial [Candidatus Thiodiazotropha sp. (ex Cardiolucina cf. quadrata)]|nr:hypothetical protein [Candidatus Thiodiazotropha sp. (ex Cardiolucina cf. quadrata)]